MTRRWTIGLLTGGAFILLTVCGPLADKQSYRFRMTVEAQTPQGLKSGSGVMEVSAWHKFRFTSEESSITGAFKGQAVMVDLPEGPIFVLLRNLRDFTLYEGATRTLAQGLAYDSRSDHVAVVGKLGSWFGGAKADMPRGYWPLMVRFRNLNDPRTVEEVDPEAIGVKRIALTTTRDDVTTGIEKRLGWLHYGPALDPGGWRSSPPTLGSKIDPSMFSTELRK